MKYFYSNGNALPHIDTFTAGSHVVYVCEVKNYVFNAIRLEEQGWEIRDCIKILQEGSSKQALLLRKSFKGTVATNVLENGCGGINIDICRISHDDPMIIRKDFDSNSGDIFTRAKGNEAGPSPKGRFPANLLISHSESCEYKGQKMVKGNGHVPKKGKANPFGGKNDVPQEESYFKEEIVADYDCVADCPILKLDLQSGIAKSQGRATTGGSGNVWTLEKDSSKEIGYGDIGGASRFFFSYENEEHLDIYLTNLIKVE
jgi:hypothetical protein